MRPRSGQRPPYTTDRRQPDVRSQSKHQPESFTQYDKVSLSRCAIRPLLRAVQDAHGVADNAVCGKMWRAIDDEFTGADYAPDAATFWVTAQFLHLQTNAVVNSRRRPWAIGLDLLEDCDTILDRVERPFQLHAVSEAFRSAAARRSLNWASTWSCGIAERE